MAGERMCACSAVPRSWRASGRVVEWTWLLACCEAQWDRLAAVPRASDAIGPLVVGVDTGTSARVGACHSGWCTRARSSCLQLAHSNITARVVPVRFSPNADHREGRGLASSATSRRSSEQASAHTWAEVEQSGSASCRRISENRTQPVTDRGRSYSGRPFPRPDRTLIRSKGGHFGSEHCCRFSHAARETRWRSGDDRQSPAS